MFLFSLIKIQPPPCGTLVSNEYQIHRISVKVLPQTHTRFSNLDVMFLITWRKLNKDLFVVSYAVVNSLGFRELLHYNFMMNKMLSNAANLKSVKTSTDGIFIVN